MKLYHIRKENGFNQHTFYGWLKETGLIEKGPAGYIPGPMAWEEMALLTTKKIDDTGKVHNVTQVTVSKSKVADLITAYLNSGKPNLYNKRKQEEELQLKLQELQKRLEKIESKLTQLPLT